VSKIVLIGGGSFTWGPAFLRDIFVTPELSGSTVVLADIASERVDVVYALGKKIIADFKLDFQLEKTLSLTEALRAADFILLTITTGGLAAMRVDLEIPARYGIRQSVGDTTGPGGLSRALRNIPIVAEIGRQVMAICPNALFLNYTNPLTVLTRTLAMQGVRVVGLCHEWLGVREKLALIFGMAPEQIQATVAGINHLIWVMDLHANGKRLWDELPGVADKILSGEIKVDAGDTSVFADHARVKATLFQLYGALPAAGDRHIAEFFPHFINASTGWGASYELRLTTVEDRRKMEGEAKALIEAALQGAVPLGPLMRTASGEAANQIMRAMARGESYVGMMNLPNSGQVSNLPREAVVETYGVIDPVGAQALPIGHVPAGIQTVVEHHIRQQEMTVEAALTGSRELALQVLLSDPISSRLTVPQARQMLAEMLEANKVYLSKYS
jgi:alpha-galactosidase